MSLKGIAPRNITRSPTFFVAPVLVATSEKQGHINRSSTYTTFYTHAAVISTFTEVKGAMTHPQVALTFMPPPPIPVALQAIRRE